MYNVRPYRDGIAQLIELISRRSKKHELQMSSFCTQAGEVGCKTTYCIAGYAHVLVHGTDPDDVTATESSITALHKLLDPKGTKSNSMIFQTAMYNLWNGGGISMDEFDQLPLATRRKAAIRVLEDFAATGKVDWKAVTPKHVHINADV